MAGQRKQNIKKKRGVYCQCTVALYSTIESRKRFGTYNIQDINQITIYRLTAYYGTMTPIIKQTNAATNMALTQYNQTYPPHNTQPTKSTTLPHGIKTTTRFTILISEPNQAGKEDLCDEIKKTL